jgi:alkylhydroperoxidase family enzyme
VSIAVENQNRPLVSLLESDAVPMATLRSRYAAVLALVDTLLGVVPNCDAYLEIWPPAFRSYNVMVPNLLNLPLLIWGLGAPRSTIGLAMYVSSRSAGCAYCAAHTCTFALRRGATVDQVATALDGKGLSEADRAAVRVGRALSVVPVEIRAEDRDALRTHFSPKDEESIVLAIAMMGWLNKTMDALGVPLEEPTVAEVTSVIAASGWRPGQHMPNGLPAAAPPPPPDSLGKRLGVIRHAPKAVSLDKQWTKGVPDKWPAAGAFLRQATGHDFPVLGRLRHKNAIRAIATMIRDNVTESVVGRAEKLSAGLVYADAVGNTSLADQLRATGATRLADSPVQQLARAIAPSPAAVDDATVAACRTLPPAGIVEVVTFVALLQLLHRLESYFAAPGPH